MKTTSKIEVYSKPDEEGQWWWVFLENRPMFYCDSEEVARSIEGMLVWYKRHEFSGQPGKAQKNMNKILATPGVNLYTGD